VAHAYNPSYSGVRDQKDLGSKPDQANRAWDPILKKKITHTHTKNKAFHDKQKVKDFMTTKSPAEDA
jgi:hypothetical protein